MTEAAAPAGELSALGSPLRPFRFAAAGEGNKQEGGARKFIQTAQQAEEYGFDTFVVPDHLGDQIGPIAALGALTQATERIRLGTSVLANGFRNPVVLAKDLATIDVLSKGRLEVGLGAGWKQDEFLAAGLEYDSPGIRLAKLDEALTILDVLLRGQECTFQGKYYQVNGIKGTPRPRQGPRPPLCTGGGGPKMLRLAAKHADIISVVPVTTKNGKGLLSGITMEKTIEKVNLIKEAAGERFDQIELNWAITAIVITDDREKTAEMALSAIDRGLHPDLEVDVKLTVEEILNSPYVAIGSFEEIAEQIRRVRQLTGMSYVGVFPTQMDAFAPVIPLLRDE
ncbi:LLM class F420-dependent oxidoreductase [Nocardia cyriacigeorgica]|jgi:probable F420-dependent oxidoreductase|uniref:LLM class F420-dependent oxidoreductase n=4 Tax=Nocardia cyriacigeorgica TaxID=135487 RepID=A0A5R8NUP9_9NOCA|nr:LLM class F420-dependent oxidoreductase [Nocardia cyriacigeorgica]MBF6086203.1 LLM class F420-dependent oxidoreductase [Nocardia cyriacigeorgica]MBF6092294.1 LLM class F420-dependent oxidoreductase [Nocardia cyriacigeorgica]MBF6286606.1 LLM class F420-dependent oxidoreductase [Nocardia cyriacigeorgica]MBF6324422.1 LLM class F420-dependent oxidoreductase [Nocardia cyriacigeorgica]MBF6343048.1 LLM class F420-dependent oxidoreductase [Nocardia cyriacigeorgica]